MVKDFKYILKRILIGVGIALILMMIKDHGLIMKASAKSCDVEQVNYIYPWGTDTGPGLIEATRTTPNSGMYNIILQLSDYYPISLPSQYDYMEVFVPTSLVITYDAIGTGLENVETLSVVPLGGTNTNGWVTGDFDMGGIKFKFSNSIGINQVRLRIPTFGNSSDFSHTTFKAFFNNYWRVTYYSCSDDNAMLEEQQKTNDLLEDDTIDDTKTDNTINDLNSKIASNGSITQLLTLPISLYQAILNSANGNCSSVSLGSLYNHNLTLPCINLENVLGSTLYNIIDILISGLFILTFRKKMVDIFNHMTSLNDRGNELE